MKNLIAYYLFQYPRILKYKFLSKAVITGKPNIIQPLLVVGGGEVIFGKNVNIGGSSPCLYSNYSYIDVHAGAKIEIADNVILNNNFAFFCGSNISIGCKTLIGLNCQILDSDGHELDPNKRMSGNPVIAKVKIGNNVFIGSNVTILKGVKIGDNSVIATGSIVNKTIPSNVVAGGIPAKVIKSLEG